MDNIKTQKTERIDVATSLKETSSNIPGHEARMQAHCERIQREYFNKGLNHAGRPKKT